MNRRDLDSAARINSHQGSLPPTVEGSVRVTTFLMEWLEGGGGWRGEGHDEGGRG